MYSCLCSQANVVTACWVAEQPCCRSIQPREGCLRGGNGYERPGATAGGGYIHEAHSNKMTQAWGTSQSRPHGFANVPTRIERSSGQSCKPAVSSPAALLTQSTCAAHLPIVRLRRVSRSLVERALAVSLITPTLVKLHLTSPRHACTNPLCLAHQSHGTAPTGP
jgi:hypothetical protein